jgi:putative hemolysin
MKKLVRKHPVLSFLIMTYAITYTSWFLPVATQLSTEIVFFLFLLGMFGPMISAFITMTVQSESQIKIGIKSVFYSVFIFAFTILFLRIFISTQEAGIYQIEYLPYLKGMMPALKDITWVGWALYLLIALLPALGFSKVNDPQIRENFFRTLKFQWGHIGWYLFALFLFSFLFLISYFLADLINIETTEATISFPYYLLIIPFFSTFFFTGGNEEFGWRGFMQKEMQKFTNPLYTSFIIAFFWSLWHLPLHYNGLYSTGGFIDLLPRFLQAIPITILFTWFYNRSEYSIIHMTIFLISSLVAIIVSFLCSLTEAALLSMNSVKIETDKQKGLKYAMVLDKLKGNINRPIAAILILNTVAHTGGATIAGSAFDEIYGDEWIWVFSVVFTIVVLFGTEILPKVIGVSNSDTLSKYIAVPLNITIKVLYPLIYLTDLFNRLILKKKDKAAKYSLEDIQTIAKVAQIENIINKDQEDIIIKTSNLKSRKIDEVMLPISEVIYFPETISIDDFFDYAEKHLHTRYPVSRTDSPQDIFGYLNFKEIALQRDNLSTDGLQKFIRPILSVKSNQSIIQILKDLNTKKYHLAIVNNEKGEFIGMVTLEDIVEEIVGEITDEFDNE